MPAKNILKIYIENGYYHLYNRGVDKRNIFQDKNDYVVFLHFLKKYLTVDPLFPHSRKNLFGRFELLAYCLMPNHFHLLVRQFEKKAITEFIRKICTNYSMYFNKKYKREGTLFQSRYKASLIDTNIYLLHLSRYIHQNPLTILKPNQKLENYPYSSLPNYLGKTEQKWVNTQEITLILKEEFGKNETYQKFMNTKETPSYLSDISVVLEENLA